MIDQYELGPLLERALAGDATALDTLLTRLRPYLHLLVRQQRGAAPDPRLGDSDLVQETLLRIHRGCGPGAAGEGAHFQGRNVPQFLGWVGQIVRHVVIDLERRGRAEKRDAAREVAGSKVQALLSQGSNPEDVVGRAERAILVAAALDRLPAHQRQLLQWRFFDQLPFADISARTGKSVGALRVLCARALDRLAQDEQLARELGASS